MSSARIPVPLAYHWFDVGEDGRIGEEEGEAAVAW